ncbi:MAG: hypothetical protein NTX56_12010 [Proteobacteria bacterium]|nr:hypothetical protein [Pseudomonadota bacterium]
MQFLILLASVIFKASGLGDVEYRTQPAKMTTVTVHEGSSIHHDVHDMAIPVPQL